MVELKVVDFN